MPTQQNRHCEKGGNEYEAALLLQLKRGEIWGLGEHWLSKIEKLFIHEIFKAHGLNTEAGWVVLFRVFPFLFFSEKTLLQPIIF